MGSNCCATKYQSSSYELCFEESSKLILNKQNVSQQEQVQIVQIQISQISDHLTPKPEPESISRMEDLRHHVPSLQLDNIKHGYSPIEEQDKPSGNTKELRKDSAMLEIHLVGEDVQSPDQKSVMERLELASPGRNDSVYHKPQSSPSPQKKPSRKKEPSIASFQKETTFTSPRIYTTTKQIQDSSLSPSKRSIGSNGSLGIRMGVELFVNLKRAQITKVYSLGQVLGQGAFGKVWKVTHRATGLIRAMKQIKKSELFKEDEAKLFQEMNILKNLDHPHIVKLFELYQDENNYYLITEHLSGGELFGRIKKMQIFSEKRASDLIRQILLAINYCHEKKIVHRDLKPENVLFSGPEPDYNLKIIDFGCSRRFGTGKMTKRLGTPYYIAPEVLGHNYNEKCDVWSVGVILYILLCGYPPFTGKSEQEIFDKVKAGKLKFPAEEWDMVSKEAKHLIQKMISVDVNQRYSASQALSDPWFQMHTAYHPLNKKVMENLTQFQATSEFRTAIVQYIVSQMTHTKEIEDLQQTFQQLDANRDGVLSREELIQGYRRIMKNQDEAEAHVEKIISEIDKNQSGQVDYSEFVMATINSTKIISNKKIEQAFKIFDQDGDGFITKQELEDVMGSLNQDIWQIFLEETDNNKDGKISYQEFQKLFV